MQTVYTLSIFMPLQQTVGILETETESGILETEMALGEVGGREAWLAERTDTARHTRIWFH